MYFTAPSSESPVSRLRDLGRGGLQRQQTVFVLDIPAQLLLKFRDCRLHPQRPSARSGFRYTIPHTASVYRLRMTTTSCCASKAPSWRHFPPLSATLHLRRPAPLLKPSQACLCRELLHFRIGAESPHLHAAWHVAALRAFLFPKLRFPACCLVGFQLGLAARFFSVARSN